MSKQRGKPWKPYNQPNKKVPMNGSSDKKVYHTPEPVVLIPQSVEAEIWLDVVTAAVGGFSSSQWTNAKGELAMVSSQVASKSAIEAADTIVAAYRERTKGR